MLDLDKLAEEWPSPFVARSEIGKFTKGLYKPISMNSYDARGVGIKRRFFRGLKVAYLKKDVIAWLKGKVKK